MRSCAQSSPDRPSGQSRLGPPKKRIARGSWPERGSGKRRWQRRASVSQRPPKHCSGLTYAQSRNVRKKTRDRYKIKRDQFFEWNRKAGLAVKKDAKLDRAVSECFDDHYFRGLGVEEAEQTMIGIRYQTK